MPVDRSWQGSLSPALIAGLTSPSNWSLSPRGDRLAFTIEATDTRPLYVMPAAGGWPVRITPAVQRFDRPAWAPDGRRLCAVAGHKLYRMNHDGTDVVVLYEHAAGVQEPNWSPDGATIAFRSRARGWDQIWRVGFDGNDGVRLTSSAADNESLQWSPGARFIACTSTRENLLAHDIYLVNSVTGEERNLTAGSSCINTAPAWSPAGGALAFFSEQDGFFHLYVRRASGEVQQLTFGRWEDGGMHAQAPRQLCWSPDGADIAFVRNREGMQDIMVIDAAGESVRRVSAGDGNWAIVGWLPDGQHLLATFDSPVVPPDLWRLSVSGGEPAQLTFSAGGLKRSDLVAPRRASYAAPDGRPVGGFLYRPTQASQDAKVPALVVVHGGPNAQFTFAWRPIYQLLVQEGYAVYGPDFRGSSGYGRDFRQANFGEWGNADLWDIVAAADYLRGLDWIDAGRIGVYGGSYGGYLALCALTRSPTTFACGIDLYGDSDLAASYTHGDRVGRRDMQRQMGTPETNERLYRRRSPVYDAEQVEAPLLILHGKDDKRVVPLMSERMIAALQIENKYVEHVFYEGEGHGFTKPSTKQHSLERTLEFMRLHLKGKRA